MASDRAFLKGNRAPTPELMHGMDADLTPGVKYVAVENLSDSEEAEMDVSDSDEDDTKEPKSKQARTSKRATDADSAPKWSNPDPYTALPPPDESARKKTDVVKLIRKARAAAGLEHSSKPEQKIENFISFDFGDDASGPKDDHGAGDTGPLNGSRFDHRNSLHGPEPGRVLQTPATATYEALPETTSRDRSKASMGQKHRETVDLTTSPSNPSKASVDQKNRETVDLTSDPAESTRRSRKRTVGGELKNPPEVYSKTSPKTPVGGILSEWKSPSGYTGIPWLRTDHSATLNMGVW